MANATTNLSSSAIETALTSLQTNLQFYSSGFYINAYVQLVNSPFYDPNDPNIPDDARYFVTSQSSTSLSVVDSSTGATATFIGANFTSIVYNYGSTTLTFQPAPGFSTINEAFFTYTFVDSAAPGSRLIVQVNNSVATQVTLIDGGLTGTITGEFAPSGAGFLTSFTLTSTNNYLDLTNGSAFLEATNFNLSVPAQSLIDANSFIESFNGNDEVISTSNGRPIDLLGFAGNDILIAGDKLDTLVGGEGDDTYMLSSSQNTVVELAGEGNDTILSRFSYTLPESLGDNIEKLILVEAEFDDPRNASATGNSSNNDIEGNGDNNVLQGGGGDDILSGGDGNNILDGGTGADSLIGGGDNDTFIIDNIGDRITEDDTSSLGGLIDEVRSTISFNLAQQATRDLFGYGIEVITLLGNQDINATGAGQFRLLINGNSGNNVLVGGTGSDFIFGGAGNDTLQGGNIVTEIGGSGLELGGSTRNVFFIDQLAGGTGNDTYLTPLERLVNLFTDETTSVVTSSVITEGSNQGTDTVVLSNTIADAGLTTLTLGANLENFDASLTGLTKLNLVGNSLANQITGNDENNLLNGGAGADLLIGGEGNDSYIVDNIGDSITENANEGTDIVNSSISFDLSTRGANVENLTLTNGTLNGGTAVINGTGNDLANIITGNAGANILNGGVGEDTLIGGAGNDTYVVDNEDDVVVEINTGGVDLVRSTVSFNLGTSGANVENLTLANAAAINGTGNTLNNIITGNAGNNTLDGAAGADSLIGGLGDDQYVVDLIQTGTTAATFRVALQDTMTEALNAGTDTLTLRGNSFIHNVATTLTLGANLDNLDASGTGLTNLNLTGNALNNSITGNDAANILSGAAGIDTLNGGVGNDTLDGGAGTDTLIGGTGNDTYLVDIVASGITPNLIASLQDTIIEDNDTTDGIDTLRLRGNVVIPVATNIALADSLANIENLDISLTGTTRLNLTGSDANNMLTGNAAVNTLTGGLGNDTLNGGAGADLLIGGEGNDSYIVDNIGDSITENANEGTDIVNSSISFDLSTRGANVENLTLTNGTLNGGTAVINGTGNDLANIITGNAGANILNGGVGEDTLIGGAGNDTYVVDNEDDVVVEINTGGVDLVRSTVSFNLGTSGANVENLTLANAAAINGTGNTLNNIITGNAGNNTLDGAAGADSLIGGLGDDQYVVDLIQTGTTAATFRVALQDTMTEALNAGTDTLTLRGNSFIHNVATTLTLGANLDNLDASGTGLTNLNLTGNALNNSITGNDAANILSGAAGIDTLNGGVGNDTLDGGAGTDTLIGGTGNDTYLVDIVASGITPNLIASLQDTIIEDNDTTDGIDTLRLRGNVVIPVATNIALADSLANIENLDISLTGTTRLNLTGSDANNMLTGNAAVNTLTGGLGNDTLNGGAGADLLIGGEGNDSYIVDNIGDSITENANEGTDIVNSSISFDLSTRGANVENLTLTNGTLNGGTAVINGTGNDLANIITGNAGANILNGGVGEDTLIGGAGNDMLNGGTDNDLIIGGLGNDSLTGGAGADVFQWTLADKGVNGVPSVDRITDYQNADDIYDILNLQDLLQGETIDEIASYLDIVTSSSSGTISTQIRISSEGGFTDGNYTLARESNRITLEGVDLYATTGTNNETNLIQSLLQSNKLIID